LVPEKGRLLRVVEEGIRGLFSKDIGWRLFGDVSWVLLNVLLNSFAGGVLRKGGFGGGWRRGISCGSDEES